MDRMKVSQIAQSLRVSNQTVYNYLSKFRQEIGEHLIKDSGKTYLTQDGFKILTKCLGDPQPVETLKGCQNFESLILGLKSTIDTLIREHAEERQRASEERQRADTIILKLSNDIGALQKSLEYRQELKFTGKEPEKSVVVPETPKTSMDLAQIIDIEKPIVQRQIGFMESIEITFNDLWGFAFGRG